MMASAKWQQTRPSNQVPPFRPCGIRRPLGDKNPLQTRHEMRIKSTIGLAIYDKSFRLFNLFRQQNTAAAVDVKNELAIQYPQTSVFHYCDRLDEKVLKFEVFIDNPPSPFHVDVISGWPYCISAAAAEAGRSRTDSFPAPHFPAQKLSSSRKAFLAHPSSLLPSLRPSVRLSRRCDVEAQPKAKERERREGRGLPRP